MNTLQGRFTCKYIVFIKLVFFGSTANVFSLAMRGSQNLYISMRNYFSQSRFAIQCGSKCLHRLFPDPFENSSVHFYVRFVLLQPGTLRFCKMKTFTGYLDRIYCSNFSGHTMCLQGATWSTVLLLKNMLVLPSSYYILILWKVNLGSFFVTNLKTFSNQRKKRLYQSSIICTNWTRSFTSLWLILSMKRKVSILKRSEETFHLT